MAHPHNRRSDPLPDERHGAQRGREALRGTYACRDCEGLPARSRASDDRLPAERQLTQIQAVALENVNTFSFLSLVVEPRLTSQIAWYLVADTAAIEGMEYAYLEGEAGPQTFSEVGFARDGMSFKIREDFGAAIVEYRGLYKNPGA